MTKSYGSRAAHSPPLQGVSFSIGAGSSSPIVGPSGSGKSTLLHLMGTLTGRPRARSDRRLDVAELPTASSPALRARRIGFVFQQFFLLEG